MTLKLLGIAVPRRAFLLCCIYIFIDNTAELLYNLIFNSKIFIMITHQLVLQGHLNHYGFLFGGEMLKWIDTVGYVAVNIEFPGHEFVTVGLNQVVFHKSIPAGSILEFDTRLVKRGNTSATFNIDVFCNIRDNELVFTTEITFVAIDKDGNKTAIKERQ